MLKNFRSHYIQFYKNTFYMLKLCTLNFDSSRINLHIPNVALCVIFKVDYIENFF